MNMIKKMSMICFILAAFGMLSACGTVEGFGHDVSHVGHDIEKAAR